jgi:hypothetical protein
MQQQMTQAITDLDDLATIPEDYRHVEKRIVPADDLPLPKARLKWYDVCLAERVVPDQIRNEARDFLRAEAEAGRVEFRGEFGYALLHLDGEAYFLLVCVWRNINEMWQVLYGRDDNGFHLYRAKDGALKATQNIFELDATAHERRAWSRYLASARDADAKRAYLADLCTGVLV